MDRPMPSSPVEILGALEDPRVDRTKLHPLTDILVLSVLAVICGADSFVARPLRPTQRGLAAHLPGLLNGSPSHDPLGRVCARLAAAACARRGHTQAVPLTNPTDSLICRSHTTYKLLVRARAQGQHKHGHPRTVAYADPKGLHRDH